MLLERDFSNGDIPRGIGVRDVSGGDAEDFVAFDGPPALPNRRGGGGRIVVVRPRGRVVLPGGMT
jgi:hypothetical protein